MMLPAEHRKSVIDLVVCRIDLVVCRIGLPAIRLAATRLAVYRIGQGECRTDWMKRRNAESTKLSDCTAKVIIGATIAAMRPIPA